MGTWDTSHIAVYNTLDNLNFRKCDFCSFKDFQVQCRSPLHMKSEFLLSQKRSINKNRLLHEIWLIIRNRSAVLHRPCPFGGKEKKKQLLGHICGYRALLSVKEKSLRAAVCINAKKYSATVACVRSEKRKRVDRKMRNYELVGARAPLPILKIEFRRRFGHVVTQKCYVTPDPVLSPQFPN